MTQMTQICVIVGVGFVKGTICDKICHKPIPNACKVRRYRGEVDFDSSLLITKCEL